MSFLSNILTRFFLFYNRIKVTLYAVITLLLLVLFVSFTAKNEKQTVCSEVKVKINSDDNRHFLGEKDIIDMTNECQGNSVLQKRIGNLDLDAIEKHLNSNIYIRQSQVYIHHSGILNIEVWYRQPVLRIISAFGENYYIDADGKHLPLSDKFTPRVVIATGYIENQPNRTLFEKRLFAIAEYIQKDNFLKSFIGQIYVSVNGELILIPKVGNMIIEFGVPDDFVPKFNKLKIAFKKIIPYEGWNKYCSISLKFRNQIVLKKNTL